jgi:hypothetical protein
MTPFMKAAYRAASRPVILRMAWLVVIALCLSSCGRDPKKANNENFKAAIQVWLDQNPESIAVSLPVEYPDFQGKHHLDDGLEALAAKGLVAKSTAPVHEGSYSAALMEHKPGMLPGIRYDLTAKGKQYQRTSTRGITPTNVLAFAEKQVVNIVRYSEPTAAMGKTVSEVIYTYELVHVADWAKDPGVQQHYYTGRLLTDKPQEAQAVLALMSDGWRVPDR